MVNNKMPGCISPKRGRPRKSTNSHRRSKTNTNFGNVSINKTLAMGRNSKTPLEGSRDSMRQLMRPWLIEQTNNGLPGLCWCDENKTLIQINWQHASVKGFDPSNSNVVFRKWAEHTGRYDPVTPDDKKYKATFRVGLNSLKDVHREAGLCKKGKHAYVIYKLESDSKKKSTIKKSIHKRGRPKIKMETFVPVKDDHEIVDSQNDVRAYNVNLEIVPDVKIEVTSTLETDICEAVVDINSASKPRWLSHNFNLENPDTLQEPNKPVIPLTVEEYPHMSHMGYPDQFTVLGEEFNMTKDNTCSAPNTDIYSDAELQHTVDIMQKYPEQAIAQLKGDTSDYHSDSSCETYSPPHRTIEDNVNFPTQHMDASTLTESYDPRIVDAMTTNVFSALICQLMDSSSHSQNDMFTNATLTAQSPPASFSPKQTLSTPYNGVMDYSTDYTVPNLTALQPLNLGYLHQPSQGFTIAI